MDIPTDTCINNSTDNNHTDALVIDLTHGGVRIAIELRKTGQFRDIYAYDIYNTLNESDKHHLDAYDIKLIDSLDNNEIDNKIDNDLTNILDISTNNDKNKNNNNEDKDKNKDNNKDNTKSNKFIIINPIHSSFDFRSFLKNSGHSKDNYKSNNLQEITHHKAIKMILNSWNEIAIAKKNNVPIIEVTGVKGKTSVVNILKEILINLDPLVLSSLGANLYKDGKKFILKKNISITPASILETIKLVKKIANSDCKRGTDFNINNISNTFNNSNSSNSSNNFNNFNNDADMNISNIGNINTNTNTNTNINTNTNTKDNNYNNYDNYNGYNEYNLNYRSCIFESSLGVSGIGDIGILTNIAENYPIAKNTKTAKEAKEQIFDCKLVVAELETLEEYYPEKYQEFAHKINSFSLLEQSEKTGQKTNTTKANLVVNNVDYGLDISSINIYYNDIKTIYGNTISGSMSIETFAPGKHHLQNILAAITSSLSLEIDEEIIKKGLSNFKGIKGRTSQKTKKGFRIIEEINPGINIKAIENSIKMIPDLNSYFVIIGGKYGITCEEIDEKELAIYLDNLLENYPKNINIILTDELGKGIQKYMKTQLKYIKDPLKAQNFSINQEKNILFIYRSNYSQFSKR